MGYKARQMNEQLLCEIYDTRNVMIDIVYPFRKFCRDEKEHKEEALKKVIEAEPFKKFEACLEKSGTDYFCGKLPSVCDFHIWEMMDQYKIVADRNSFGDLFATIPKCK